MGARLEKKPAATIRVEQAIRRRFFPIPIRKPRFVSLAVALALISALFTAPIVARLSFLFCMFDFCKLALAVF